MDDFTFQCDAQFAVGGIDRKKITIERTIKAISINEAIARFKMFLILRNGNENCFDNFKVLVKGTWEKLNTNSAYIAFKFNILHADLSLQ